GFIVRTPLTQTTSETPQAIENPPGPTRRRQQVTGSSRFVRSLRSLLHASLLHASLLHASLLHASLLHASLLHASLWYARCARFGTLAALALVRSLRSL